MNNLHPGARWLYRWYGVRMFLPLMIFVGFITIGVASSLVNDQSISALLGALVGVFGLAVFATFIGIIEIYARMSYNRFLYEITNESIKIEQGIIWKRYTSIPYERVQNVDIQRGIIARFFGFSTVQIETAGQAGNMAYGIRFGRRNQQYKSEGYLPAVDIGGAEEIRAYIMKQIKHGHATRSGGV